MVWTIEATFSGLLFGNTWNNVVHFQTDEFPGGLSDIANILDTHWVDNFRNWQHSGISWLNIAVRDVGTTPAPATFNKTIAKVGAVGGPDADDQVALAIVVKKLTATGGRTGRGRMFIGGYLTSPSTNLGQLTPATVTAFTGTLNTVMARFGPTGDQGLTLGICSRASPVATFKPVISLQLRTVLGTMRSRNWGHGA